MPYLFDWLEDHEYVAIGIGLAAFVVITWAVGSGCIETFAGLTGWWR